MKSSTAALSLGGESLAVQINQSQAPIDFEDVDVRLARVRVALADAIHAALAGIDLGLLARPDADQAGFGQGPPHAGDGHVDLDQVGIATSAVSGGFTG